MKNTTNDLETPYEYGPKTPPPTGHLNTSSQNDDYVNSNPDEQICNIKSELVALKSFVIEQIYVLKKQGKKEGSSEGSSPVKLVQEEITYLREENKVKSEIVRMLSDKQNTFHCLHTNNRSRHYTNETYETTDSLPSTDKSNYNTDHASQDGNSLIFSQLHLNKEIKPKRLKENQSREISDEKKRTRKFRR